MIVWCYKMKKWLRMKGNVVSDIDIGDNDIGDNSGVCHNAAEGGKAAIWGFCQFSVMVPQSFSMVRWPTMSTVLVQSGNFTAQAACIEGWFLYPRGHHKGGGANISSYIDQVILIRCPNNSLTVSLYLNMGLTPLSVHEFLGFQWGRDPRHELHHMLNLRWRWVRKKGGLVGGLVLTHQWHWVLASGRPCSMMHSEHAFDCSRYSYSLIILSMTQCIKYKWMYTVNHGIAGYWLKV